MPSYSTYASFAELADRIMVRAPNVSREAALFVAEHWASVDDNGRIVLRADPAHKLPNAVLYRRSEALACWQNVSAAVLIVSGENSEFKADAKPFIDTAGYLRHGQPFAAAQQSTVPGCGHMVHLERPAELAALAEEFLEAVV